MAVTTIDTNTAQDAPARRKHVATGEPKGGARPGAGRPPVNGTPKPSAEPAPLGEGSFWEWLDGLPKEAWSQNLICYVWRCGPLIDTGNGKPTSITKLSQPFDVNMILETYGSGLYRFDVCETPPAPKQKGQCLRRAYEMILDMRYPPKIPLGTWIDDSRNASWQWCKPDLEAEVEARKVQPQQPQGNSLGDLLDLQLKLKELSGDKSDSAGMVAILVQLLQNQDPSKQVETAKALMEMAGGGKQQDTGMGLLVQILRDELNATREEMRFLRNQTPTDPLKTSLDTLKGVVGALGELGMNLNPGHSKANPAESITATIGDIVSKVIEKGAELGPALVEAYKFGKDRDYQIAMQKQQQPQPRNAERPWEYKAPEQPAAPAVAAPPPTQQPPAPPPQNGPMTPQLLFAKWGALIQGVFPYLQDHFLNYGGADFQDWFVEHKGLDTWNAFKKDATPELLTQATQMHPQLKSIFTPEEKVLAFFTDMMDETGDDEQDDDEDIPAVTQ